MTLGDQREFARVRNLEAQLARLKEECNQLKTALNKSAVKINELKKELSDAGKRR